MGTESTSYGDHRLGALIYPVADAVPSPLESHVIPTGEIGVGVRAFLSMKYWGDTRNREDVRSIIGILEQLGLETYCVAEHAEQWGNVKFTPQELMHLTFRQIDSSDLLIAHVDGWPIGVGVEAGYAYARNLPIICICPEGRRLANTVAGLAEVVVVYSDYQDLRRRISQLPIIKALPSGEKG